MSLKPKGSWRPPERPRQPRYVFVSKELSVRPVLQLGTDGKPKLSGKFEYYVERGTGNTHTRSTKKPPSRRDRHRGAPRNLWGAEPYVAAREAADRTWAQQKLSQQWKELQANA